MDKDDPLKRVSTTDLHSVAHLEQLQDAREKTAEVMYKVQSKRIRDDQRFPAKRSRWQVVLRFFNQIYPLEDYEALSDFIICALARPPSLTATNTNIAVETNIDETKTATA